MKKKNVGGVYFRLNIPTSEPLSTTSIYWQCSNHQATLRTWDESDENHPPDGDRHCCWSCAHNDDWRQIIVEWWSDGNRSRSWPKLPPSKENCSLSRSKCHDEQTFSNLLKILSKHFTFARISRVYNIWSNWLILFQDSLCIFNCILDQWVIQV